MIGQIKINNLKSFDDFDLKTKSVEVSYPTPKLITKSIPFQNGEYDFTELYGDVVYNNRSVKVTFQYDGLKAAKRTRIYSLYTKVVNWLYNSGKSDLIIDYEVGIFKGRVVNISPVEVLEGLGEITVEFDCYPFRISTLQDGHDIWDEFNFELDMVQETKFTINGTQTIKLYNNGSIGINPTIICSAEMQIKKGSITYNFAQGTSKSIFKLDKGLNELTITGNGSIEFKWYKELL